ncbi:CopD family protein [Rhodoferax sp. UBA5149]|uniref:CopD family protein n=1 Tax=Rhodoferax sp. UBA5149 TaxID=1947379 RepID=UPI0025DCBECC|nr:CopD family protein [Rhodoferax sp. UBA5149]
MFYATLKTIHLLSVIVWIGGMVFAQFFLRPAVARLEVPDRVRLMHDVLGRFFNAVLVAAGLALASGVWMMGRIARQTLQSGIKVSMPLEWIVMALLGVVMLGIFGYIRVSLYPSLTRAVTAAAWPAAGAALARIRTWVMVNLVIGVVIVAVTLLGASS